MTIQLKNVLGDITECEVDTIVNAANKSLLGGGGVDGAIHRAAGPKLLEECKTLGGAKTAEAKITKGYQLAADYVIHTVGPVYQDGEQGEAEDLKAAYQNSLLLAEEKKLKSIAFPAISTGAYGYPMEEASEIALESVEDLRTQLKFLEEIIFVSFDEKNFNLYEEKIQKLKKGE
ncbi:MAG: O-acetyl-ADP-ribose deacetylase [Atopostipes sp.]|nr:O-acetyl-ADP-ribose deacetylase [Atopostipes sp.]